VDMLQDYRQSSYSADRGQTGLPARGEEEREELVNMILMTNLNVLVSRIVMGWTDEIRGEVGEVEHTRDQIQRLKLVKFLRR
jgi:hypothetical protein